MTKKLTLLLLAAIFMMPALLMAQKPKTVHATGSAISHDLTPEQTRNKAIEDAKRNALAAAGVAETVSFTDFSYKFGDNTRFQEIFQAISSIETGGEIIVDEILNEKKYFNEFGNMVVEVEIEATIYRHREKSDPGFVFIVEGIDEVYKNADLLKFQVTPAKPGYLKIFNITDEESYLLYPWRDRAHPQYSDVQDKLFAAGETVTLPLHAAFSDGYYLEIETPDKQQEFNILMFVFTKKDIPFIGEGSFNNIMKWIYAIPPDERTTQQVGFIIKKGSGER
ncbi:MAG: DUF4384 domain-containing protein [Bacteroidales bacterium]|jgi:hypothetical protein|nr:DUF4384 domain-containing protein [Bacteroidales bacterium]MDD3131289.1 DUF4384 domain-containing protein [Bacteroidales bacterium]MDD4177687.1 DUF4384 domain-containing protein [Bacteroidales bacterium]MDY0334885.1 DUF4384 domain-containing protein [Bacteroidales bacterium]